MLWTRFCWSQQWSRTSCLQAATFSCWSSSASAHTTSSRCVHKAQTHTRTWIHACTQTFTCSGVLVCELGTADIRKRNQRRNRFMLQNPHQVNENLVITLMCERYGPLRNSCSVWSYLPVISGEFLQMSHLTWGWIAYIGHFTHFLNHYPNCQVSPVFLSSFLSLL